MQIVMRRITPLACWLSSAPVHFSVGLGHGLQVSARLQLPNKRRKVCRGDVSNAAVNLTPEAALPEQAGGLAGELQKRIGACNSQLGPSISTCVCLDRSTH